MIRSLSVHSSIPSTLSPQLAKQAMFITPTMITKETKGEVGTLITKLIYCNKKRKFAIVFNHSYMDSHYYSYKGFFTSNRTRAEEEFNK